MMEETRIYKKRGESVVRQIAGETLLIPIRGRLADMQRIFALDPVAEHIWNRIDGQSSVGRIAEDIAARFEVEAADAARDLGVFLAALSAEGLIDSVETTPPGKDRSKL